MALPLIQDNYQATVTDEVVSASATAVTLSVTPDSTRTTGHLYVFDTTGTLVEHVYYGARSSTQVSSMVRGLSLVTGADTAGTGVTWYRGYVVKMAPGSSDINPIKNVMNGTEAFPAIPKNPSTRTISDPRHHVDLEYLQAQTTSGVASIAVTKNGADPTATFNVAAGYLRVDAADVAYAGASAQPTVADATNYVYLTRAGALMKSVASFPTDSVPLATLVVAGTADVSQATQDAAQPFGQAAAAVVKAVQSFIAGATGYVSASFYKRADTGTFTGTVTVSIQADSAGAPSGTALASKTFTNAEWILLAADEKQTAIFGTAATGLTVSGLYWLVFEASTSDTSNCPNIGKITTSAYAGGVLATYNGTSWSNTTSDLYFTVNTAHSITTVTDRRQIITSDVTAAEAAALAGTSGTPSGSNKFVTNDDTSSTPVANKVVRFDSGGNIPNDKLIKTFTAGQDIAATDAVYLAPIIQQDATSSGTIANLVGGALTVSHTVAASTSGILFACIFIENTSGITGTPTYNGDNMTLIDTYQTASEGVFLYYIANPDSGTHDISVTRASTSNKMDVIGVSYTGVTLTSPIDQSNKSTSDTDLTFDVTTTAANEWAILACISTVADLAAGINSVSILTGPGQGARANVFQKSGFDPIATGAFQMTANGTGDRGGVMATFKPVDTTASYYLRKTDADVLESANRYLGVAPSAISALATGSVALGGVVGGFSSLTVGRKYYLSNTPGALSLTEGTYSMVAGSPVSATEMLILRDTVSEYAAVTTTADGTGVGAIPAGAKHVTVTSDGATRQVSLPPPVVGKKLTIWVGTNGMELVTVASSNVKINDVDADGTNQVDVPADTLLRLTCVSSTQWLCEATTKLGATLTALIPDND